MKVISHNLSLWRISCTPCAVFSLRVAAGEREREGKELCKFGRSISPSLSRSFLFFKFSLPFKSSFPEVLHPSLSFSLGLPLSLSFYLSFSYLTSLVFPTPHSLSFLSSLSASLSLVPLALFPFLTLPSPLKLISFFFLLSSLYSLSHSHTLFFVHTLPLLPQYLLPIFRLSVPQVYTLKYFSQPPQFFRRSSFLLLSLHLLPFLLLFRLLKVCVWTYFFISRMTT